MVLLYGPCRIINLNVLQETKVPLRYTICCTISEKMLHACNESLNKVQENL